MLDDADHRLRCLELVIGQFGGGHHDQIVNVAAAYAAFVVHGDVPVIAANPPARVAAES